MKVVTLDFETYYSKECGFSKLNTQQYIMHPDFHSLMVAVKVDEGETFIIEGTDDEIGQQVRDLVDWSTYALLAHNTRFDGAIMAWRWDIHPKFFLDTMSMANAKIKPYTASASLKVCAEYYQLPSKGTAVTNALGKKRRDFTADEWEEYKEYCIHDTDLCYAIFKRLMDDGYARTELMIIDHNLRMFIYPKIQLNGRLLRRNAEEIKAAKEALLNHPVLNTISDNIIDKVTSLRSDKQFEQVLKDNNIPIHYKWSDKQQKKVPAFAKTDEYMKRLVMCREGSAASVLANARLAVKSSIAETRTQRFIDMSVLSPMLPIPLRYSAAHTHRFGGDDSLNVQNLGRGSVLRQALEAPEGKKIVVCDLSQVEIRVNAYLAGEERMLSVFRSGEDIYCNFASQAFGRTVTKSDKEDRFLGKTSILGLGFGMGETLFNTTLKSAGVKDIAIGRTLHRAYRAAYPTLVSHWKHLELRLHEALTTGQRIPYDMAGVSYIKKDKIVMPYGLEIAYPNMRFDSGERSLVFDKYQRVNSSVSKRMWGGYLVENLVQSIARGILADQWLRVYMKYGERPAMQVHDELIYVIDEDNAEEFLKNLIAEMCIPPRWCTDLPLGAEGDIADNYGEAK